MPGLVTEQASVMEVPIVNGTQHNLSNGISAKPAVQQNGEYIVGSLNGTTQDVGAGEQAGHHGSVNGVAQHEKEEKDAELLANRPDGLPMEVRQLIQHFRPFHRLIHRSVQQTWNSFSDLIDQLSEITVAPNITPPNASYAKAQINGTASGDQSHENLEKKDRLLKFQQDQRALYIKFLVLHDWFQKSRGIDQVIEISMWIHDQRTHFAQAADFIGNMKRELALWQVPNPDLKTATEVLSIGRVSALSDLGYVPVPPLSSRGMLRTLQDINILLCTRLSLHDQVPPALSKYRIHDGRVTFIVRHEFELDLSVADEDPSSQFYFIDFRYLFLQRSTFLSGRLHNDFASKINDVLRTEGLPGCYSFLHDLTLSHKLSSLRRQALDMARKQWSESLRVDLINRTLVVQYWLNRPMPKSWIEIGVKSGRRKKRRDRLGSTGPFLDLRWIPEKKENCEIQVDFNASPLSIENILRGVISRHSSIILDRLYEKLLCFRLYTDGKHSLELSSSDAEPNDCSLHIQLTRSKHITLSVEPISGFLIIRPASPLTGRTEFELNRLQNPVEGGVERISMLRCLAAEQEFAKQANIAGWEVLQTFRLSQRELKALFAPEMLRYVLVRQASWQQNVMIAATFSIEGDNYWLLYPGREDLLRGSVTLVSQRLDCSSLQEENEMNSMSFFSQLKEYASGAITFKVAEQELRQRRLHCQFPALLKLENDFQLPRMKVQYLLANAKRALSPYLLDMESKRGQMQKYHATQDDKKNDHPSWIQPTVCLRFCGLNKTSHSARLLAKGRTTASAKVLESLATLTGSDFKVNIDASEFLMSFQVLIGTSVVSELFTRLQNLDNLLSCLTIVKSFDSMRIQSLSLSQITIEYNREARLSTSIDFPSSESMVAIQLFPQHNPHARISHFIENLLADLRRPFTANLGGILTMLTTTLPLLTLFDELEELQTLSEPEVGKIATAFSPRVRPHVVARSPTHYALQYFSSSTDTRIMIARFEIFHHLRRDTPVWVLRPALEETVAYSRFSFVNIALKQKLVDEIFNVRGAQGWLGLDTGASCPIDRPGLLLRKVDDIVKTWAMESLTGVLEEVQKQERSSEHETRERVTEPVRVADAPTNPTQHQQQQHHHQQRQRPGNGGSRPANGTSQSRPPINTQRTAPQRQKTTKDVITLD